MSHVNVTTANTTSHSHTTAPSSESTNTNSLSSTLVTLRLRLTALESRLNAIEAKQEQVRRQQRLILMIRFVSVLSSVKVGLVIGRQVGLVGQGDEVKLNIWIRGLGEVVDSIQAMLEMDEGNEQLGGKRKRKG